MKQEFEISAKTVDEALKNGASQLGVDPSVLSYEVLREPKKGFLGFGEAPATIRITYETSCADVGLEFVNTLIGNLGIDAEAVMAPAGENGYRIDIEGPDVGILIGHHGETLDALQYLVNLAANRREGEKSEYNRITVDIENYRAKREETLRALARRMAQKVLRYHRSVTLEPMNPYERRIIHSELQSFEGVTTVSVGTDHNRRVVVYPEGDEAPVFGDTERRGRRGGRDGSRRSNFDIFNETRSADDTSDESDEVTETAEEDSAYDAAEEEASEE